MQNAEGNLLYQIALAAQIGSAKTKIRTQELKKHLKNTYEAILTAKKCLSERGLLLEEINSRPNYALYNFILTDKTAARGRTLPHYFIEKDKLDEYVHAFNSEQSMRINGKPFEFSHKSDVLITATKLKTVEEVELYKKRYGIRGDMSFAKSAICSVLTSQLITSNMSIQSPKPTKSIDDLVKKGKIKDALELALAEIHLSEDDRTELTLALSWFNKLEDDKRKGVITNGEYKADYAKITLGLIHKIKEWREFE